MTDDRFEHIIRDAARDYNRPPEITPREEMWARIQEAQRATAAAPVMRVERGGATPERSFAKRAPWRALAAAAGILLVAGIGIGRLTGGNPASVVPKTAIPRVVAATPAEETPRAATPNANADSESEPVAKSGPASRRAASDVRVASLPLSHNGNARRPVRSELDVEANRMNATYQLASLRHLAETEAMLTTFRTDSANRAMDPVVAKWSRDLLSNTRLLLDSPAARDPLRKHLLEDLELVLTQIVQLSNTPNANERDMVESTIKEGHVMTRLRTAIPAGRPQGT
ncbi:MAG: hypothetical protein H0W69_01415 [Gemmatimonadaceae bacterium]|nr:hypothetical protein [Gemmatimonadaceae bacterium]